MASRPIGTREEVVRDHSDPGEHHLGLFGELELGIGSSSMISTV